MILSSLFMELCKWKEEFIDSNAVEAYRFVLWVDGIFQAQWQGQWENMIAFLLSRDETAAESKAYMNNIILGIQMKSGSSMIIVWSSILLLALFPLWGLCALMYRNAVWLVALLYNWMGIVGCRPHLSEALFLQIDLSQSRQHSLICHEEKSCTVVQLASIENASLPFE